MDNEHMITNDVLGAKLDAVGQRVEKVELKVDNLGTSYVPHDIFELRLKELEVKILAIQKSLVNRATKNWLLNTLSAVVAVILTLLLQFYITNVHK